MPHFLELHQPGDIRIGRSAGRFLGSALGAGGVAIAIATPRAAKGILRELGRMGHDPVTAMQLGRFMLFESTNMLGRFYSRNGLSAERFESIAGEVIHEAKARADGAPLHAYGDMVGVLWQREKYEAAVELERLWNGLQERIGFELYCAYPIDVLGPDFCAGALDGVFETHTRLMPAESSAELGRALDRAMDEVLGERAMHVRSLDAQFAGEGWASMPKLESMILRLRAAVPEAAGTILSRARAHYERSAPRPYLRLEHSRG